MASYSVVSAIAQRLGRYTLLRPLGAGGMAELFLARVEGIGGFSKLCAVKRILPHKAANERFVRMLLNEARLVATLDHPNIAQVHDIGVENGEYFFAMEYVHGQDLRHVLHAAPRHQVRLENALHIILGVCAGLHHAHDARDAEGRSLEIVHRDVSPSNVLVSYQGAVKLVDFGVAKAATVISETREGIIKGKFGYMSPEQCLGAPLDRRSDIFALGILLWELTVGRRLYKLSADLATMQRVVYVDAPAPSRFVTDYPPELERIVLRALARDPARRYQTAQELQLALEAFAVERRLGISAVAMSQEMHELFAHPIAEWQEAEQAGRSLADHLAKQGPPAEVDSSDQISAVEAELDGMIAQLALATPPAPAPDQTTAEAKVDPPQPMAQIRSSQPMTEVRSSRGMARAPMTTGSATRFEMPNPLVAPRRLRNKTIPLILVVLVLGVFSTLWLLLHQTS
jgi:eukaryotic-like serine/threonine-protein kinase